MFMADSPEFVAVYLAAMRIGAVPVPVSTMLHADGLAELLRDSRARLLAVTAEFADRRPRPPRDAPELRGVLRPRPVPTPAAGAPLDDARPATGRRRSYPTTRRLAGVLALHLRHHRHAEGARCTGTARSRSSARRTARRCSASARTTAACPRPRRSSPTGWATRVLFPLSVGRGRGAGAGAVPAGRCWPSGRRSTARRCSSPGRRSSPTCCAPSCRPTRWPACGSRVGAARRCRPRSTSAGPAHFGVDILDGIGMTEMLHIFLSNRPGEVRPGTTGVAVPGYDLRDPRRRRPPTVAGRHAGHAVRAGRVHRHRLLVPLRRLPAGVPGRVAAHRRHLRAGRRRLLHLPRPHRRHAQGQRHLGVAGRGRGAGCSPTTRSRRPSSSPRPTPTAWRSRSPTSCCATARARPRTS